MQGAQDWGGTGLGWHRASGDLLLPGAVNLLPSLLPVSPLLLCTSPKRSQMQVAVPSPGESLGFPSGSPSQRHFSCSAVLLCPCLVQPGLSVSRGAGGGLWSLHSPSFRGCCHPLPWGGCRWGFSCQSRAWGHLPVQQVVSLQHLLGSS